MDSQWDAYQGITKLLQYLNGLYGEERRVQAEVMLQFAMLLLDEREVEGERSASESRPQVLQN